MRWSHIKTGAKGFRKRVCYVVESKTFPFGSSSFRRKNLFGPMSLVVPSLSKDFPLRDIKRKQV